MTKRPLIFRLTDIFFLTFCAYLVMASLGLIPSLTAPTTYHKVTDTRGWNMATPLPSDGSCWPEIDDDLVIRIYCYGVDY